MKRLDVETAIDLLRKAAGPAAAAKAPDFGQIAFKPSDPASAQDILTSNGIGFEVIDQEFVVSTREWPFKLFLDTAQFRDHVRLEHFSNDIGILYCGPTQAFAIWNGVARIPREKPDDCRYIFENCFAFLRVKGYFQQEAAAMSTAANSASTVAGNISIVSFHSSVARYFAVLSPEKSILHLGYPSEVPELDWTVPLGKPVEMFIHRVETLEFRPFVREALYEYVSTTTVHDRLQRFVESLSLILEAANRNYEVYLRRFSFDELRSDFRKEREAHFAALRDVSKSLYGQLVGVPVSIATVALALWNLREQPILLVAVVAAFHVYSVVAVALLMLARGENNQVRRDLTADLADLHSKFKTLPERTDVEVTRVGFRIDALQALISILLSAIITSALALVILACYVAPSPARGWFVSVAIFSLCIHAATLLKSWRADPPV